MLSDASASDDRLVDVDFAVSNLQVEFAIGICADPRFVVNCSTLRSEVRQWH